MTAPASERKIGTALDLTVAALILAAGGVCFFKYQLGSIAYIDLMGLWLSGKIFGAGGNPYNAAALAQHLAMYGRHLDVGHPCLIWHPPWGYPYLYLLSLLAYPSLAAIWLVCVLALLFAAYIVAARSLPEAQDGSGRSLPIVLFFITLYPGYFAAWMGQITPLLLLFFCLYLYCGQAERTASRRLFWGGFFLALTLNKPQLLYLVYAFAGMRCLTLRQWPLLWGGLTGFLLLNAAAFLINPGIYADYFEILSRLPLYWDTPTLGAWFDKLCGFRCAWLRYLPTIGVFGGYLLYAAFGGRHSRDRDLVYVLTPLSLFTTAYCWTYDYVLLIPTALWIFSRLARMNPVSRRNRTIQTVIPALLVTGNIAMFFMPGLRMQYSLWYPLLMFAAAWLVLKLPPTDEKSRLE